MNNVTVSGTVLELPEYSYQTDGENFYTLVLAYRRNNGSTIRIPVTVSAKRVDVDGIKEGDPYEVVGSIRSYGRPTGSRQKTVIFASSFTKRGEVEYKNFVRLDGTIARRAMDLSHTPTGKKLQHIRMHVENGRRKDYVACSAVGQVAEKLHELRSGVHVSVSGRLNPSVWITKSGTVETSLEVSIFSFRVVGDENSVAALRPSLENNVQQAEPKQDSAPAKAAPAEASEE